MSLKKQLLWPALIFCAANFADADTLQLKNQAAVTGAILAEKPDEVIVDVGYTVLVVPRSSIATITKSGTQYLIMWDSSQSCANGSCTTSNQTVGSHFTQYQDMTTASTPIDISGRLVPVGIKPIVLH